MSQFLKLEITYVHVLKTLGCDRVLFRTNKASPVPGLTRACLTIWTDVAYDQGESYVRDELGLIVDEVTNLRPENER